MKIRLDKLLVDRGHAQSRERATALIIAGRVLVEEQKVEKPGTAVEESAVVRMLGDDLQFVSRGGLKLERALDYWAIDLAGQKTMDVGASTGGFTDCMLQRGAVAVLAIDTGWGQIAQKLRSDPRVSLMERTNARLLEAHSLVEVGATFFAMDVSFISATLVLPAVLRALASEESPWRGEMVLLVKPQFEAGREHVGKGGIVREPAARMMAIARVRGTAEELGGTELDVIDSPITGMEGNHEYLLRARFGESKATVIKGITGIRTDRVGRG